MSRRRLDEETKKTWEKLVDEYVTALSNSKCEILTDECAVLRNGGW